MELNRHPLALEASCGRRRHRNEHRWPQLPRRAEPMCAVSRPDIPLGHGYSVLGSRR
jgi:hypothetical protein